MLPPAGRFYVLLYFLVALEQLSVMYFSQLRLHLKLLHELLLLDLLLLQGGQFLLSFRQALLAGLQFVQRVTDPLLYC